MKFSLYSRVALAVDVPAEGIRRGDVATIVEQHDSPAPGMEPGYSVEVFNAVGETLAVLTLRTKLTDGEPWSLNGPGTRSGLLVISSAPGSGKSQLALDLLAQLSRQGVRFAFFDLKGEFEDDPNNARQQETRRKFFSQTGASYVRLIRSDLPINPLGAGFM